MLIDWFIHLFNFIHWDFLYAGNFASSEVQLKYIEEVHLFFE